MPTPAPQPTIAALEAAVAADALDTWLALLPAGETRDIARQAIAIDRGLWAEHPASLASCLLARTFLVPQLAALHAAWCGELDARPSPWIRPLRPLPTPMGLLAEVRGLHEWSSPADPALRAGLDLQGLALPRFESDDVLVVAAHPLARRFRDQADRRRDRLRWTWSRGEAQLEADPEADQPGPEQRYPRVKMAAGGAIRLVRAPGSPPEELPCPAWSHTRGYFSRDGQRLLLTCSPDDDAGSFAMVLDPRDLRVVREVYLATSITHLCECDDADRLLLCDFEGALFLWEGGEARALPVTSRAACLSPSGRYLATRDETVRVWSLDDLGVLPAKPNRRDFQFPTGFDPSGDRLVADGRLRDGRTGLPLANLSFRFAIYLEGGPASPWFHIGTKHIVCMHTCWQLNDAQSGRRIESPERSCFYHPRTQAFDRAGELVAVTGGSPPAITLYELPSAQQRRAIPSSAAHVALHPDGHLVAGRTDRVVEVWCAASGEHRRRFVHPTGKPAWSGGDRTTLCFSRDGRRLASFLEGDGWRLWSIDDEQESEGADDEHLRAYEAIVEVSDFAPPRSADWTIETGPTTVFVHRPTGTRIALPVAGLWIHNPACPEIVACTRMHVELRVGGSAAR